MNHGFLSVLQVVILIPAVTISHRHYLDRPPSDRRKRRWLQVSAALSLVHGVFVADTWELFEWSLVALRPLTMGASGGALIVYLYYSYEYGLIGAGDGAEEGEEVATASPPRSERADTDASL